jgi:hypothetical protein
VKIKYNIKSPIMKKINLNNRTFLFSNGLNFFTTPETNVLLDKIFRREYEIGHHWWKRFRRKQEMDIIGGKASGNMKWILLENAGWKYENGYNWRNAEAEYEMDKSYKFSKY